jgi:hypothetical protein
VVKVVQRGRFSVSIYGEADPMTATTRTKHPWDTRQYRRIATARHEAGRLIVEFEDGAVVGLAAADVLPPRARMPNRAARVDPYEVIVPTADGDVEVPWSAIRVLADPEYDAHLAAAAVDQRRRIGRRIEELRLRQGMAAGELARRADLSLEHLARIEAGDPAIDFPPVQRLLDAMGRTLDDLVVAPGARFDGEDRA